MGKHLDPLDLDMFAADLADMIDKFNYPISGDITDDTIRKALPVFLAAMGIDVHGQPLFSPPEAPPAAEPPLTMHTCNPKRPGQPLPFGRKAPEGECPRCDELRAGAPARSAPAWIDEYRKVRDGDAVRAEEIRQHFAPGGPHERRTCAPQGVCTTFDW